MSIELDNDLDRPHKPVIRGLYYWYKRPLVGIIKGECSYFNHDRNMWVKLYRVKVLHAVHPDPDEREALMERFGKGEELQHACAFGEAADDPTWTFIAGPCSKYSYAEEEKEKIIISNSLNVFCDCCKQKEDHFPVKSTPVTSEDLRLSPDC